MNTYCKDNNAQDLILDSTQFQVMMEWEREYMAALIDNLDPVGDVLEIGFGLGYSSNRIQSKNIRSHTIIEADVEGIKKCKEWAAQQKVPVYIIEGLWQEELANLGRFDSIFFDDSPSEKYPDPDNIRIYDFYYRLLNSHVYKKSKLSWYCDTAIYWLNNPFTDFTNTIFRVNVSDECNYVERDTTYLSMPVVNFKYGTVPNMRGYAFTNKYEIKEV